MTPFQLCKCHPLPESYDDNGRRRCKKCWLLRRENERKKGRCYYRRPYGGMKRTA